MSKEFAPQCTEAQTAQPIKDTPSGLFERFEAFYSNFGEASFDEIGDIYDERVQFADPVHQVLGLEKVRAYLKNSLNNLVYCRFEFQDRLCLGHQATVTWRMCFAHEKLRAGEDIVVPGCSILRFDDKITFHQDYYDMGAMVYEHIPILGWGIGTIKRRIAS